MLTVRAPLRIPLGGGGTDLPSYYTRYGGFILSAGIDKYVYIHLNDLKVEKFIRVKYARTELVERAEDIEHPLLRETLLHTACQGGIEISAMADFPGRTGMGSSGSFTVALLAALKTHSATSYSRQDLAEEAYFIEANRAAQPAGKHDHYLAAFGGLTCMHIDQHGHVEVEPLKIAPQTKINLLESMLIFFTGIERESFDILDQQQQDTQRGDAQVIDSLHQVKRIGYKIKAALEAGNTDYVGDLMDEHWQMKKQRSTQMSNPDIDKWYDQGRSAGALGGKILGAGGGGFLLFYCPVEHQHKVRQAMTSAGLKETTFHFDAEGVKTLLHI